MRECEDEFNLFKYIIDDYNNQNETYTIQKKSIKLNFAFYKNKKGKILGKNLIRTVKIQKGFLV